MAASRQRLDKWLWFARVLKSRTLAARFVTDGHVRLNGQRVTTPAYPASIGDVLTIALDRHVRVLRIADIAERRGPFSKACLLYDDLSDPERPALARSKSAPASLRAIDGGVDPLAMPGRSD